MKRITFLILLFAAVAIIISTCKQVPSTSSLPQVQLKDLQGNLVNLAQYQGKPLIVNFWATWCGPCRYEIPMLNELYKRYAKQNLVIIGISTDVDGPEAVKTFQRELPMVYPVFMETEGTEERFGGILGLPTTFFFDKKGAKINSAEGLQSRDYFEEQIQKIL